ncbi:MAG: hypothetical protein QM817_05410 [Archangium sp.]
MKAATRDDLGRRSAPPARPLRDDLQHHDPHRHRGGTVTPSTRAMIWAGDPRHHRGRAAMIFGVMIHRGGTVTPSTRAMAWAGDPGRAATICGAMILILIEAAP